MNTKWINSLILIFLPCIVSSQTWPIHQSDDPNQFYVISCTVGEIHGDHFHEAIDINCDESYSANGVEVRPVEDGKVLYVGSYSVLIGHDLNVNTYQRFSRYLHLTPKNGLTAGNLVSPASTILGYVDGSTIGGYDNNHLHLEMGENNGNNTQVGVDAIILHPLSNSSGWQLVLPLEHEDLYAPQINDIIVKTSNNQANNVPSGFCTVPEDIDGAVPFHNQYLKVHMNDTQFSTLSTGSEYDYPSEKIVVWGNISFIVNARDVGVNSQPGNGNTTIGGGEGLTVKSIGYSYINQSNIAHDKYNISFSEMLHGERDNIHQLFHHPYFDPIHFLYGNNDFIELYSSNNTYLHIHQQINGIQSNGIWFTKAHESTPHVFNQTPTQIAAANELALYKDGEQTLRFSVEDAAGQEANEDLHVIVDNFIPFIKKVEIYKEGNLSTPEYSRGWAWQGGQYVFDQEPGANFQEDENIWVYVYSSESMQKINLELGSFNEANLQSNDTEGLEWVFQVSSNNFEAGTVQLEIDGNDLGGNPVSGLPSVLSVHQQNGTWLPAEAMGPDTFHSFEAAISYGPPSVDFEADILFPNVSEAVHFTSSSPDSKSSYTWTFTSNLTVNYIEGTYESPNPVVSFSGGTGNVDVSLKIENAYGETTKVKDNYIQVDNPNLNPAYPEFCTSSGLTNVSAGQTINFIDQSENEPNTWYWQFEGGSPASTSNQNPGDIYYSTPGFYNVSLQVSNDFGNVHTLVKENYIGVYEVLPVLNMDCWLDKNIVALYENVLLSATTFNGTPPFTYTFNFNDEAINTFISSSYLEEETFSFSTPGNKMLTVSISDASNPVKTAICSQYISVDQIGPMHTVDFEWDPPNPMLGQEITFTNLTPELPGSVLNYSHWSWGADLTTGNTPEVPDTVPYTEYVTYPNPLASPSTTAKYDSLGSYPVTLTVSDMNGWQVSKTKYINFNDDDAGCIYFNGKGNTYSSNGLEIFPSGPIASDDNTISFRGYATDYVNSCTPPQAHYEYITDTRWRMYYAVNDEIVPGGYKREYCNYSCEEMHQNYKCTFWFTYNSGNIVNYENIEKGEYYVECEIWNRCADPDIYNGYYLNPSYAYALPYYDVVRKYFKVVDCDELITFSLDVSGSHPEIWAGTINMDGEVLSGGVLTCIGHEEINMQPGFTAHDGSDFTAKIIPCPDCSDSIRVFPKMLTNSKDEEIALSNKQINSFGKNIEIYPNPTTGFVNIVLNFQSNENIDIEVQQMNGNVIRTQMYAHAENIILNLSPYPPGIYLLLIKTPEKVYTEKIVLQ